MKKQKRIHNVTSKAVSVGILTRRKWPWLFAIVAAIAAAVFYLIVAVEFNNSVRCSYCTTYYAYLFHYEKEINTLWTLIGCLLLLTIVCAILFVRKRKLILTPSTLVYQRGRRSCVIPFTSIKNVKDNKRGITVRVPGRKFKFKKIKNKREFCISLSTLLKLPLVTAKKAKNTSPAITEGKIQYFESLYNAGLITKAQFNKYVSAALSATDIYC